MKTSKRSIKEKNEYGIGTRALATFCKNCGICAFANKKPNSNFGRVMAWHREWCPARLSHNKVYGLKGDV